MESIAAVNSSAKSKQQADYVCDGINDDVEIQAAIDALPSTGGIVQLMEGNFMLGAVLSREIDNVMIRGTGFSTYLQHDATTRLISFGIRKNWTIQDLRLDYGGFEAATATHWNLINVWLDSQNNPTTTQLHIDTWGADHLYTQNYPDIRPTIDNHPLVKVLDDMEKSDWTPSSVTLTFDTTIHYTGTQSMKIVTAIGSGGAVVKKFAAPIDLVNAGFSFMVYTPDHSAIAAIQLVVRANNAWVAQDSTDYIAISTQDNRWWKFNVSHLVVDNGADLSSATHIKINVVPVSGKSATVYIDDLRYWKNGILTPKGAVTLDFDDGHASVPIYAKPLMDKYNYAGNWGIIIDPSVTDGITLTNSRIMQSQGWDIVNHSLNHEKSKVLVEPATEFILAQKWLAENGFAKGARFTILPYGMHDKTLMDLTDSNVAITRGVMSGYNSLPGISSPIRNFVMGNGQAQSVYKAYIDNVKANKTWVVFMGHIVSPTADADDTISTANLQYILDYCYSQGVEVLTYSQICDRIEHYGNTSSGSATIKNGTTSLTVRHGFIGSPSSIQITPTSSLGNAHSICVSNKDVGSKGSMFQVDVDVDPGVDVTFDWRAVL